MGADCQIEVHLKKGIAAHVIPKTIKGLEVDLVIMGNLARTGVAGYLIGNTAERIIDKADTGILTMKSDAFVSPIK